jgi:hypothetical protein
LEFQEVPTSTLHAASRTRSFLGTCLRDLAIDLRPPVVEAVDLVLSRYTNNAFVTSSCRLNLCDHDFLPIGARLNKRSAGYVYNSASPNEPKPALFPDTVHGYREYVVF